MFMGSGHVYSHEHLSEQYRDSLDFPKNIALFVVCVNPDFSCPRCVRLSKHWRIAKCGWTLCVFFSVSSLIAPCLGCLLSFLFESGGG